jgi:hypothetical protein
MQNETAKQEKLWRRRESNPVDRCGSRSVSDGSSVAGYEEVESASSVSIGLDAPSGRKVEDSRDPICERLALALARWGAEPNANVLRRALLEVLIAME